MLSVYNIKTKKDLKARVGSHSNGVFQETGLFGQEYRDNGSFNVVGPGPYDRKWYATVTVKDGVIIKVS